MESFRNYSYNCTTYLIDISTKKSLGHNWEYARIFRRYYHLLGKNFSFISPSAFEAQMEDNFINAASNYLECDNNSESITSAIKILEIDIKKSNTKEIHIFFLWGAQLNNQAIGQLEFLEEITGKRIYIQILGKFPATLSRYSNLGQREWEDFIIDRFSKFIIPVTFLAWDSRSALDVFPPVKSFTEHFQYSEITSTSHVRDKLAYNSISFFGNLTHSRGLGDFLLFALMNPRIRFNITGYGRVDRSFWRPRGYQSKLRSPVKWLVGLTVSSFAVLTTKLPNVEYRPDFFLENHSDLEMAIKKANCIYYSSKFSGISSGIVSMALFFEIPIIWKPGNSPSSELLKQNFPLGEICASQFKPWKLKILLAMVQASNAIKSELTESAFKRDLLELCKIHG